MKSFKIVNDFEACAYGLLSLKPEEQINTNKAVPLELGLKVVAGPGTGFGLCQLIPYKNNQELRYQAFATEYGHALFSPTSEEHLEFFHFMRKQKTTEFLGMEDALTGISFPYSYKFFKEKYPECELVFENETKYNVNGYDFPKKFPSSQLFEYGKLNKD